MGNTTEGLCCSGIAVSNHSDQQNAGTDLYISTTGSELNISALRSEERPVILDKATDFAALDSLKKRAKAKYLTYALVYKLLDVEGTTLTKSYWSTWHCSNILQKTGDKLKAKYCKQRWCIVCSRIRTALVIKQYLPAFSTWDDKQFVTLTVPNCTAEDLPTVLKAMKDALDEIRKQMDNDYRRGKRKNSLVGARKLEVTYNTTTKDYHPHYHFIIRDAEVAHDLREQWLTLLSNTSWDGQDVRSADNDSVLELCKYFTKLISSHSKERIIEVDPLDVIFRAVKGMRVFQAYKVKAAKHAITDEEADALAAKIEVETIYEWEQSSTDWIEKTTGECLTGFTPDKHLEKLVKKGIIRSPAPVLSALPLAKT